MRKFKTYGLCGIAATALLVAGCGGGGSNTRAAAPSAPPPSDEVPASILEMTFAALGAGESSEMTIEAGGTRTSGGVVFSCPGERDCSVTIMKDADGAVTGMWTGGEVTAMKATGSVSGEIASTAFAMVDPGMSSDSFDIPAGEMMDKGGVRFTCGSEAGCTVDVMKDAHGTVSATWMGGMVTAAPAIGMVADEISMTAFADGAPSDPITIAAGREVITGGVIFLCGPEAECSVTVKKTDDGTVSAMWTGGNVEARANEGTASVSQTAFATLENGGTKKIEIPAGEMTAPDGGVIFECGPEAGCTVTVTKDDQGAVLAMWMGGNVEARTNEGTASVSQTAFATLENGRTKKIEIPAGEMTAPDGGVIFECGPEAGCTVTVTKDDQGAVSAMWMGGMVEAKANEGMVSVSQTAFATLENGGTKKIEIPAGEMTAPDGGVIFECGPEAGCTVTVTKDDQGAVLAMWMGGNVEAEANEGKLFRKDIPQTTGLLIADLPEGEITIPAGMSSDNIGGVEFMCADDAGCTVTVTKDDQGNVEAEWTGGEVNAKFVDPVGEFNSVNEQKVAMIMGVDMDAAASSGPPATPAGAYSTRHSSLASSLGGLHGGMLGTSSSVSNAGAANNSMLTVSGAFDPTASTVTEVTAENDDVNKMMPGKAGALGLDGWKHQVLHRDWGDTDPEGSNIRDNGLETVALVYSNIGAPGDVKFPMVASMVADSTIRPWFTLQDGDSNPNTPMVVVIDTATNGWDVPIENMLFSVEGSTVSEITLVKQEGDSVRGTYFDAKGLFTCAGTTCRMTRTNQADIGNAPFKAVEGQGTWHFLPDDGQTVFLPDQDWLAFGVWLTAPDHVDEGMHRIGVIFDGMETYDYSAASALTGTANYAGSAAGYYVNGADDGLFTADANLKLDLGNDMLSGRIDNFRNSEGMYIDSDNRDMPNDPNRGGENDWVVLLNSASVGSDGGITSGTIDGAADGVVWTEGDGSGQWSAQLYGPGHRLTPVVAPTGVAGDFRAVTRNLGTSDAPVYKGVVGAFGAMEDK